MNDDHLHREPGTLTASSVNGTRFLLFVWPLPLLAGAVIAGIAGSLIPLLIGGAITGLTAPFAVPRLRRQWMWRIPELQVAQLPFMLGDQVAITYERRSRRPVDVGSATLHLHLECEEKVQWETGSGKNRRTRSASRTVAEHDFTVPVEATADGLRAMATIVIPIAEGAPTLGLSDNQIRWTLSTTLDGGRLPTASESFDLDVASAIGPAARPRPTDDLRPERRSDDGSTNPFIDIDDQVVELGDELRGFATMRPDPHDNAVVRGLRLELNWRTHGRGDTDSGQIATVELPTDAAGTVNAPWTIAIPDDAPISYDGKLIAVVYELTATVDRKRARDRADAAPIIVVPRHGRRLYVSDPHPHVTS